MMISISKKELEAGRYMMFFKSLMMAERKLGHPVSLSWDNVIEDKTHIHFWVK